MPSPQPHSVASELLVNDRTLVVPAPPLSITTAGDLVWIAYADGKVEVRNTRTGEVVRRFEPAVSGIVTTAPSSSAAAAAVDILSNVTNRAPAAKAPSILRRGANKDTAAATSVGVDGPVIVCALLAVPTVDGDAHVWMGLSNGCIEVHHGGVLPSTASGENRNSSGGGGRRTTVGLLALLRKHTAAITSLAEFGGYVYSGSEDRQILQWRACHSVYVRLFSSRSPHDGPVRCLYAEGNALVSGSDDCTVKVWDVGEGAMRLTGYFHSQSGGVLALCRVGEYMWSGDASGQVVRWHLRTCEAAGIHTPHSGRVLALCRVGDRVYSGSADGTMGIFDAANGQLLQHVTDQALGWVTAVECPAELSRFVVWSSSADGAVRCWYQDEYTNMTADEVRFNDASWYVSGSTPYREFRAAVGQRTQRLKEQLGAIEHRDKQAMTLLRRCSTVFGGGGAGLESQQQRLQDQLAKVEERCRATEERVEARRSAVAQMDRDIAATLALLQNARSELNLLIPGEAERVLASMPAIATEDLIAYNPNPPVVMLDSAGAGAGVGAPLDSWKASAGLAPQPPLLSSLVPPPPTVAVPGAPGATAPPPGTYATSTAVPVGPPAPLGPVPAPPAGVDVPGAGVPPPPPSLAGAMAPPPALPVAAATPSSLGVGGPLSGVAPPPLPLPPAAATAPVPPPGGAAAPLPLPTAALLPGGGSAPPTAGAGGADGTTVGSVSAAVAGVAGVAGAGVAGAGVVGPAGSSVAAGAADATAGAGAAHTAKRGAGAAAAVDDGVMWTNPHVGNYIQRRYYGASPSLRTTDLMKEEKRRGRLRRVKVEPLQRNRSRSPAAAAAAAAAAAVPHDGSSRSAKVRAQRTTTTSKTTTTKTTTVNTTERVLAAPARAAVA
ncbi:WD domain, G-beta repeat [Novymonas esmeraldas]|uniref:WD domain, G-beta repeat n=1 Tax=Novymonas esmeraldas TaxID=1808958 RepID=A0AAW0ESA7_9TRYP